MAAGRILPAHVRACQHSDDPRAKWFVWSWRRDNPAKKVRVPYSCNSWRCVGHPCDDHYRHGWDRAKPGCPDCRQGCSRHEGAVTFARIRDACEPLDASGFVFFVLTLDRDSYRKRAPWPDARAAYKALGGMSERFLKRLRRAMTARGWDAFGSEWAAVVEMHKAGWPHMNLLVYAPELAAHLARENEAKQLIGFNRDEARLLDGFVLGCAEGATWGHRSTAERVEDREAIAGYITKLAAKADATSGELAKITQAPLNAPKRFRRLRSGKGFLPERFKSGDEWTGCLVRRERSRQGDWEVKRMNPPKDRAQVPHVHEAALHEMNLIFKEEDDQRAAVQLVALGFPMPRRSFVVVRESRAPP